MDIKSEKEKKSKYILFELTQESNRQVSIRIYDSFEEVIEAFTDDICYQYRLSGFSKPFTEQEQKYIDSSVEAQKFYRCLYSRKSHGYFCWFQQYNNGCAFDLSDDALDEFPEEYSE
jgi:hypothetical protein